VKKKKKTLACVVCIDVARGKHKNNYFGVREARTLDLRITRKLWDLRSSQLRHHPGCGEWFISYLYLSFTKNTIYMHFTTPVAQAAQLWEREIIELVWKQKRKTQSRNSRLTRYYHQTRLYNVIANMPSSKVWFKSNCLIIRKEKPNVSFDLQSHPIIPWKQNPIW
jgi:hypothetical protein